MVVLIVVVVGVVVVVLEATRHVGEVEVEVGVHRHGAQGLLVGSARRCLEGTRRSTPAAVVHRLRGRRHGSSSRMKQYNCRRG